MEIEIFTLCDAATDMGGKLNILGTFDRINTWQFPAVHPHCAVALRVRFDKIEEGKHRVKISFVDQDGKAVLPSLDGNIEVRMAPDVRSLCANMVVNLNGLKFDKAEQYSLDLGLDGRHERSLPVTVALVERPAQPPHLGDAPPAPGA